MNKLFAGLLAALALATDASAADQHVRGYVKKDGTYVAPHYRTTPNVTTSDNYSTRGNVNPYTGEPGTKPDTRPAPGAYVPYGSTGGSTLYRPPSGSSPSSPQRSAPCTSIYGC